MCENCQYQECLNQIHDMLLDDDYCFAEDTLIGIKKWILEKEHVTERQKESVNNIFNSMRKKSRR